MKNVRMILVLFLASVVAACNDAPEPVVLVDSIRADSLSLLRSELAEQTMQASMFVNEVNKELARARSLTPKPKQLLTSSELIEVNEERNATLARVAQLVERLDAARGRIAGLRKEISDKDSTFKLQIEGWERMLAEAKADAERQRAELQEVINGQTAQIQSLSRKVDTLVSEKNTVYVVSGTREELVQKGVLVPTGRKRYFVAGKRRVTPAPDLDPSVFTKLDLRSDTTILLPEGVFKIVSQQNGSYSVPQDWKDGGIVGGLTIENPERFWNTSRYLILVRS